MENVFTESDQTIVFPNSWWVIRLDKHKYYTRLSGQGLKAVDFLALDRDFGLVLIELKNYHGADIPKELPQVIDQKCRDTDRLIKIVNRYLHRKFYYRLFFLWLKWYAVCDKEWLFWAKANECLAEGRVLRLLDVQE